MQRKSSRSEGLPNLACTNFQWQIGLHLHCLKYPQIWFWETSDSWLFAFFERWIFALLKGRYVLFSNLHSQICALFKLLRSSCNISSAGEFELASIIMDDIWFSLTPLILEKHLSVIMYWVNICHLGNHRFKLTHHIHGYCTKWHTYIYICLFPQQRGDG